MNILQLTKKFPYPLKDGESIAVTNLSKSLVAQGCKMTLLSMNTSKHFVDINKLPDTYNHYDTIHTEYLDNRVTLLGAIKNLFNADSYHVSRFDYKEYSDKLIDLLSNNDYDIIQLETLYLAPYIEVIRRHSKAKIVMRSHNVEFEIWNRIIASISFLPKRWYISYLTKKLKNFEIERLSHYDALVTVTQRDLDKYVSLGYDNKGVASPIGVDINKYQPKDNIGQELSFSFIGSLDWMPNLDGLDWFLKDIWSAVISKKSDMKLHIAGRNTPKSIISIASDNILIHGEVDSAIDFVNEHPIMIVPLLSGSGMRVKILEGMALGKVVISTSIGAEGIDAVHKESIMIADTKDEFEDVIEWLSQNKDQISVIGNNARAFIATHFDEMNNAEKLIQFYETL